ncbi:hypothetical protein GQX74_007049 [Glossina fuscipes]|nr:hypothetical protein GQX74_007049 [Glossina fuscipes]
MFTSYRIAGYTTANISNCKASAKKMTLSQQMKLFPEGNDFHYSIFNNPIFVVLSQWREGIFNSRPPCAPLCLTLIWHYLFFLFFLVFCYKDLKLLDDMSLAYTLVLRMTDIYAGDPGSNPVGID